MTSVTVTSLFGVNGQPDPSQVYGLLYSNGSPVPWPGTLTSISISNLPPITAKATAKLLYASNTQVTATSIFGQFYVGDVASPWPATAIGNVISTSTGSATTSPTPTGSASAVSTASTSSAQTASTLNTSATPATTNTKTGTSKSPTPTSSTSPPVSSHSSGISTGATAGIAIGCALVGLAIGLLLAFCLFRRKGKRNSLVGNGVLPREFEAYPSDKGAPVHDVQLNQFLLEATPDRDIVQETQSIGSLIDQHVESYYHTHPITVDTRALASVLSQSGFLFTTNPACLDAQGAAALCLDPRSRRVGLRHILMRVLFSSIDVHPFHGPSMLPAPAASFLRAIPPAESDRFGDPQEKASPFLRLTALAANAVALRKWRNLSAFLLHPARSQRTSLPPGDAAVAMQAQELASSLNSFLRFFVDQQQQHQQVGHLQAMIEECGKLGYMLFSHPSDWEFIYEASAPTPGVVVEAVI
ncbi:hypothetical protein LLEC1_05186 [Akanthomyces lecanii]|uniref:Uncharacterized protein n=1 Tax=Cordyceps confragosa TaxID=2714763 RepID=A0A179II16_CORDF|nr:hypothetical protein LLEC1_05186 [Akanthomyces lecanii]